MRDYRDGKLECQSECKPPCRETKYDTTVTFSAMQKQAGEENSSSIRVNVFFDDFSCTTVENLFYYEVKIILYYIGRIRRSLCKAIKYTVAQN